MISERAVDVSVVRLDRLSSGVINSMRSVLSEGERARADGFRFRVDAHRYIASHAALRRLLGERLGTPPESHEFAVSPAGKPWLPAAPRLAFNLSHSGDLAVIAIAWDCRVGVDVEVAANRRNHRSIARRYFAARYLRHLGQLGPVERSGVFAQLWCRFEALQKADGRGIRDGARLPDGPLPVPRPPAFGQIANRHQAGGWLLADLGVAPSYRAALACDSAYATVAVEEFSVGPLPVGLVTMPGQPCNRVR